MFVPDVAFNETVAVISGLLVALLIVTAEVVVGTPVLQLPAVVQAVGEPDVQPTHAAGVA
jgi:hypothetical protein